MGPGRGPAGPWFQEPSGTERQVTRWRFQRRPTGGGDLLDTTGLVREDASWTNDIASCLRSEVSPMSGNHRSAARGLGRGDDFNLARPPRASNFNHRIVRKRRASK